MGADKTNQENSSKPEQAQQNESAPGKLGDEPQQAEPGKDAAASEEQRKSRLPGCATGNPIIAEMHDCAAGETSPL